MKKNKNISKIKLKPYCNPLGKAADWKDQNWSGRAVSCYSFLALHGFLDYAEWRRARNRVNRWMKSYEKARRVA